MRKQIFLRISAGIIAVLLIIVLFLVANAFLGNPVSSYMAKRKASAYLDDQYGHLDLEIKKVNYFPKDGSYYISVGSNSSIDTHFSLNYRAGEIIGDDYETAVLSGMNTMKRFRDEYKKALTRLVQAETSNVTNITVIPEKLTKYNIDLDSAFDKNLIKNVTIIIRSIGGTDATHLADVLRITDDIMKKNGYAAIRFGITGEHETSLIELENIKPEHIESDDFEEILQKAIADTEYDGITAFSKSLD